MLCRFYYLQSNAVLTNRETGSKGKHLEHKLLAGAYRVIKIRCKGGKKNGKGKSEEVITKKIFKFLTVFTFVPDPAQPLEGLMATDHSVD